MDGNLKRKQMKKPWPVLSRSTRNAPAVLCNLPVLRRDVTNESAAGTKKQSGRETTSEISFWAVNRKSSTLSNKYL